MTHLPPATDPGADLEDQPAPDLHGDNLDGHQAARQAIESALVTMPNGTGARTVEAKAGHIHAQLVAKGWHLAKPDAGCDLVQVGPDEQVITFPDGATVSIHPPGETALYGPAVAGHPDLEFLAVVCDQLDRMAPDARERVAAYLTDRYSPTPPAATPWAALSGWDPSRIQRTAADSEAVGGGHA